jgi:alpha-glucan,water dikinase
MQDLEYVDLPWRKQLVTKKSDLNKAKVLGYSRRPMGLFIRQSIIFRSDSNGKDIEGYAGVGLYDNVPMDEEDKRTLDYSLDPLVVDHNFRENILSMIAQVGVIIKELYGSPQDVEGVVKDSEIYVDNTRHQMQRMLTRNKISTNENYKF